MSNSQRIAEEPSEARSSGENPMSTEIRPVQMRLREETIQAIDSLKVFFEVSSRTDAVVRAVRLAGAIAREIRSGSRVELHRSNGQVLELFIQ